MTFAVIGSGAVGGYIGARLARAGHTVILVARGAHLKAIRERGLLVWSPLGDFTVRARAEDDPVQVGVVDVAIVAVKTYDNRTALAMLPPMVGPATTVLTLQNGVDSVHEIAAIVGPQAVLGGAVYLATALSAPGLIEQTGVHRRIVVGEVFGSHLRLTPRVEAIRDALAASDMQVEAVPDARASLWEKFVYLAPFAGFTGAARLPIGPLWQQPGFPGLYRAAMTEVDRVARAEGVDTSAGVADEVVRYIESIPGSTRSSLLIDLQMGKRIEVEALLGAVVRRGRDAGITTPIMATLYAVLKPYEDGPLTGAPRR